HLRRSVQVADRAALSRDGVDGGNCRAAHSLPHAGGLYVLVARRRCCVFRRRPLLARTFASVQPLCVAPFRDCRRGLSLFRGALVLRIAIGNPTGREGAASCWTLNAPSLTVGFLQLCYHLRIQNV